MISLNGVRCVVFCALKIGIIIIWFEMENRMNEQFFFLFRFLFIYCQKKRKTTQWKFKWWIALAAVKTSAENRILLSVEIWNSKISHPFDVSFEVPDRTEAQKRTRRKIDSQNDDGTSRKKYIEIKMRAEEKQTWYYMIDWNIVVWYTVYSHMVWQQTTTFIWMNSSLVLIFISFSLFAHLIIIIQF